MKCKCPNCGEEINISFFLNKKETLPQSEQYEQTLSLIEAIVLENADIKPSEFRASTRIRPVTKARGQFWWLAKKYTKASLKTMGSYVRKGIDHSTVIHGINTMADLMTVYEQDAREMMYLQDRIEEVLKQRLLKAS